MRRSKYHSMGIMDAIERLLFGGVPNLNRDNLFREVLKNKEVERDIFSKRIYSLQKNGFIKYKNDQEFILTSKGLERIKFNKLERLELNRKRKDGFWRVIIFDIPEIKRGARELLRNKLVEFGCYQLQKSVYATPYVCEEEIAEISRLLEIGKYVSVIVAKCLGSKEVKVVQYFDKL